MLVGIIKEETNKDDYYIHYDDNKLSIIHVNEDNIDVLDKDKINNLFNQIFSSKLTYKEKIDEYDIYLDESNNKRYFKNGVEDLELLFKVNGIDAILYFEKVRKDTPRNRRIKIATSILVFEIMFNPIFILPVFASSPSILDDIDLAVKFYHGLNIDEMQELIENSNNLDDEEKYLLNNKDLLEMVLKESNSKRREYILRNSLDNVKLKFFDNKDDPCRLGFYDCFDMNTIHICDEVRNTNQYMGVLTHEYIHLLQDNNKYHYIREASADIINAEYYGNPEPSYPELVKRIKVLMEIIGPKPILECNFKGATKGFENELGKYLSNEEKCELLDLFTTPAQLLHGGFLEKTNKKIDELLRKMYTKKTGKNMNQDELINFVYYGYLDNRLYFNQNREEFNKPTYLNNERKELGDLELDDVVNSNNVEVYRWSKECKKEIEGKTVVTYDIIETTDFNDIKIGDGDWIDIEFIDGTRGHVAYSYVANTWSKVEHYELVANTAPSIKEKFKDQFQDEIEILDMFEEDATKDSVKVR